MSAASDKRDPVALYCDPTLTANIYCAGLIDQLIHSAVRPFWQDAREQLADASCYLWLMRYRRSGYHLKVRLHGPESARAALADGLQKSVGEFFASVGDAPGAEVASHQIAAGDLPIDEEDLATTNHPDRSLVWTHYNRSHVSLGSPPFMEDDRYVGYFTRCLARGCERVLGELRPDREGNFTNASRQSILLRLLIEGQAALGFSAAKSIDYLTYHRDWLVRFSIFKSKTNPGKASEIVRHFENRYEGMRNVVGRALRPAAAQLIVSPDGSAARTAWQDSLGALKAYVLPLCVDENHQLDPYASDPLYPVVFKALHGVANQLGIHFLEESFAYHLLLSCLAEEAQPHLAGEAAARHGRYDQAV